MLAKPILLDKTSRQLLHELEHGSDHLFITGKAGTGKSTLLDLFRRTTARNIAVLAPTGVAALHVQGQTIHSFFNLPPRFVAPGSLESARRKTSLWKKLDTLVIDEISMVRAEIMDHIDFLLRRARKKDLPFGGVRLLLFGDLFQLPPVVNRQTDGQVFHLFYDTPYFFSSQAIRRLDLKLVELTHVYRQEQKEFLRLLDEIRFGTADEDSLELVNTRVEPDFDESVPYVHLCTLQQLAQSINLKKMDQLEGVGRTFTAEVSGRFPETSAPAQHHLFLKPGAQVMFLRNDAEQQYVNGTIGQVAEISTDKILVSKQDDTHGSNLIEVRQTSWEFTEYQLDAQDSSRITTTTAGTFRQFPLAPAWAITIHKSQGKTFDRIVLDLGRGAFEHGQTYVALSRCRTLEGIVLKRPLRLNDLMVDDRIIDFMQQIR